MSAAVFGVIGGIVSLSMAPFFATSSGLGLQSFVEGGKVQPIDDNVRIYTGTPSRKGGDSYGGNQPGVALFSDDGHRIGQTPGESQVVSDDAFVDVLVRPNTRQANRRATYMAISDGGDDGICIAGIEITHSTGKRNFLIGNMVAGCGNASWYFSDVPFGVKGKEMRPVCFWLDRDSSNSMSHQGISVHIPDIDPIQARVDQYTKMPQTWCDSKPRFSMHKKLRVENEIPIFHPKLEYNGDGTDKNIHEVLHPADIWSGYRPITPPHLASIASTEIGSDGTFTNGTHAPAEEDAISFKGSITTRRRNARRQDARSQKLVRSDRSEHSARALCEAPTSFGPSFTNPVESLHCDMATKTLYRLCAKDVTGTCFDDNTYELRESALEASSDNAAVPMSFDTSKVHKKYTDVQIWG